jgi:nucleotide-binding universal stress UspA family protein
VSVAGIPAPIRRILIALDASPGSIAALEAAGALAARVDAELLGVFIEDVNLLNLAGLPFAAEVGLLSAGPRPLTPEEMERYLRDQGARAHVALTEIAERLQLRASFRVARGQIVSELLAAAGDVDLLALGAISTQMLRRAWLGSTAQAIMAQSMHPLLITPRGATVRSPIGVVCTESPGSMQALMLAAYVSARLDGGELVVLLVADDEEKEEQLRHAVAARLGEMASARMRYRWLVEADVNGLARALRAERVGTLVLASDIAELSTQSVRALLERMDVAVLLTGVSQSVVDQSGRTSPGS